MPPLRACSISQYTPSTALHPLSSLRMPGRPRRVGEQPQCSPLVGHVRRQRHWARHAARWVAGAVLHTIPEEAEGAVVEVVLQPLRYLTAAAVRALTSGCAILSCRRV